nr:lysylphosphatidylglycerol synthase domain-containing protein [Lysobacter enzymogenes]
MGPEPAGQVPARQDLAGRGAQRVVRRRTPRRADLRVVRARTVAVAGHRRGDRRAGCAGCAVAARRSRAPVRPARLRRRGQRRALWRRVPAVVAARLPAALAGWNEGLPARAVLARVWLLQWLAYAAMCAAFAVLVRGFGLELDLARSSAALCLAGLAGVLAVLVPAGLGVREAGLFWCLAPLVGAGNAAMLALAWRLAITAGEAAFAAASFALGALRRR